MANFTITTRLKKRNGEYLIPSSGLVSVYIAVSHNGVTRHINTGLKTLFSSMNKAYNRLGNLTYEVGDFFVIKECMELIEQYMDKANRYGANKMTCNELVKLLERDEDSIPFFQFANSYVAEMINNGKPSAGSYKSALANFKKYIGHTRITFKEIDRKLVEGWIKSLMHTRRAREMYPTIIKTIFNAGIDHYNDYDRGIMYITNNPFKRIVIPKAALPKKRSIDAEEIKKFFEYEEVKESIFFSETIQSRESIAKDVCVMVFCLAGINTADLYHMKKDNYKKGKLCYNRRKTRSSRDDSAYVEIKVIDYIQPLFEKYLDESEEEYLFTFYKRYRDHQSLNKSTNQGLTRIAKGMGLPNLTSYTFRHSWATIAQNHCGASTGDVAFALNHASQHRVTERYISIDYSPIDRLNEKVVNYVLNS